MPEQTYDYLIAPKASFDATADAIRTMKGSQDSITWGQDGFAEAIGDERRYTIDDILTPGLPTLTGDVIFNGTELPIAAFVNNTAITSFTGNNVTLLQTRSRYGSSFNTTYTFAGCTNLQTINLPSLTSLAYCDRAFQNCTSLINFNIPFKTMSSLGAATFNHCTHLPSLVLPAFNDPFAADLFSYCSDIEYIDVGESVSSSNANKFLAGNALRYSSNLNVLIFRNTSYIFVLQNVSAFTGTPFASGGTGGTLYVPNDLIASYQAATNWSTILGYENNQIKSIESTHTDLNAPIDLTLYYADGTPISTT